MVLIIIQLPECYNVGINEFLSQSGFTEERANPSIASLKYMGVWGA